MIWRLMDTYDLVKGIKEPFTSRVVYEKMLNLGIPRKYIRSYYCEHLTRLAKQGYLTITGGKKGQTGNAVYIYEVVRNE